MQTASCRASEALKHGYTEGQKNRQSPVTTKHSDSLTPMKRFQTNCCGLCTDLLAIELNREVVSGLSRSPLLKKIYFLSLVRCVVGDDCLEILLVGFQTTREKLGVFLSFTKLKIKRTLHFVSFFLQDRGRRKSSQKLAKRRAFVWGGGGGAVSTVFAKQASKKKEKGERKMSYARCAPTGPAANRFELDRAASLIDTKPRTMLLMYLLLIFVDSPTGLESLIVGDFQ